MPYIMVRHQVEDFDKWKAAFDADAGNREQVGSNGGYVLQNLDDENAVTVLLEFDEDRLEDVRRFLNSESLAETMQAAGVLGEPQVFVLDDAIEFSH